MKETQIRHHKQKSAFETNRRAPLPSVGFQGQAGWGSGPRPTLALELALECPVRREDQAPPRTDCLHCGMRREMGEQAQEQRDSDSPGQRADPCAWPGSRPTPGPC